MDQRRDPETPPLRVHQAIAHDLGAAILAGRYRPGDGFEGEIEHAGQLKVSRSAYREAVRILIAKGFLESRPKTGTRVRARKHWNLLDPQVLGWMFEGEPDQRFVEDLFELRAVIEPAAAALAAGRRDEAHLARMADGLEGMRRHGLASPEGRSADQRFHRAILEASGNEALQVLASSVGAAVDWTTKLKERRRRLPRNPLPDHVSVYEAIASGDAERARSAMADLIRLALQDLQANGPRR